MDPMQPTQSTQPMPMGPMGRGGRPGLAWMLGLRVAMSLLVGALGVALLAGGTRADRRHPAGPGRGAARDDRDDVEPSASPPGTGRGLAGPAVLGRPGGMRSIRRQRGRTVVAGLLAVLVVAAGCTSGSSGPSATPTTTATSAHPNVLFVLTDDLDLGEIAKMPHPPVG